MSIKQLCHIMYTFIILSGSLTNWSITFYGTEDLPACVKYHNCENVKNQRELHIEHSYPIRGVSDSPHLSAVSTF